MDHSDSLEELAHEALAAHLRAERARAGLTQADLSERTGIHTTTLSRIENGKLTLTIEQILRIAPALGVTAGDFLNAAQAQTVKARGKKVGK
ncbi:helix-turn-helix domain-containing protein [Nocardia fluminea]|uniref:DNA-binding XRE family transcriptional regulator n=1 Tax=Nocardia fluminea TaxID=134984 RepID=A0A2N3VGW3_9NOCA|nr:helix-turn-helix transcriptional regulator [Nocardia fluminea]PKV80850.1 DNA-binding XRE family transcriptional regulator [Nocardia fluminea]